jgi:hypothetical protein
MIGQPCELLLFQATAFSVGCCDQLDLTMMDARIISRGTCCLLPASILCPSPYAVDTITNNLIRAVIKRQTKGGVCSLAATVANGNLVQANETMERAHSLAHFGMQGAETGPGAQPESKGMYRLTCNKMIYDLRGFRRAFQATCTRQPRSV